MRLELLRDGSGKAVAIDRQGPPGRQLVRIGSRHDQRACPAHLLMQETDCIGFPFVGAEGVRANKLGKAVRLMRRGLAQGTHLVKSYRYASLRELPGCLASCKSATNHLNFACHA